MVELAPSTGEYPAVSLLSSHGPAPEILFVKFVLFVYDRRCKEKFINKPIPESQCQVNFLSQSNWVSQHWSGSHIRLLLPLTLTQLPDRPPSETDTTTG